MTGAPTGVLGGDDAGAQLRVLDLRLLLPALLAWGVLVALLPRPVEAIAVTSIACLTGALVLLRRARASRRSGRARLVAMSCAAVGLVTGATALHVATSDAGLVTRWAEQRATSQVELVVTTEPRVVTRGDERQPLVVLEARVSRAQARGQVTTPRTPVVIFASAGQGWEDVRWRSTVATTGRWAPAEPGERTRAVLTPRGGPSVLAEPAVLLRGVDVVRDRFREALQPLPADSRGLVPGLVIGDTSLTPPDLTEAMRLTGMTHLSAVSGSNVGSAYGSGHGERRPTRPAGADQVGRQSRVRQSITTPR
ncbi:ComEC/Rec2 family competence protein [Ornithinimicrobium sufpigmenti]|uniref:ComEC/Rec2 family competence protein n=1 Tax=Ornithinimicrobium sufpigmenti TaxID=2508882 RepID=UPI0010369776|nr:MULTISPECIES: ComEC/Rec2 family competence protein [unclassified Ornithinimicrobium]